MAISTQRLSEIREQATLGTERYRVLTELLIESIASHLKPVYQLVLQAGKNGVTARMVAEYFGWRPESASSRLDMLGRTGLIEAEQVRDGIGKHNIWRARA